MEEMAQSINSALEQFYEQLKADYPYLAEVEPNADLRGTFETIARELAFEWIERGGLKNANA